MSTTESSESFQISREIAEFYESAFVPAFFGQWAPILCQAAGVAPGHHVLGVGCGTGIVTRTAADRVAPGGRAVGVDVNEAMLGVARRVRPDIEFRQADAARLPFADESFDTALSQMALMFFPDRTAAVQEMARVTTLGGLTQDRRPLREERGHERRLVELGDLNGNLEGLRRFGGGHAGMLRRRLEPSIGQLPYSTSRPGCEALAA